MSIGTPAVTTSQSYLPPLATQAIARGTSEGSGAAEDASKVFGGYVAAQAPTQAEPDKSGTDSTAQGLRDFAVFALTLSGDLTITPLGRHAVQSLVEKTDITPVDALHMFISPPSFVVSKVARHIIG